MGDTSGTEIRTVPAESRREVDARSEGICEFPLCDNEIWTDFDHDTPHCRGGSQEPDNGNNYCKLHHRHKHRRFFRKVTLEDGSVVFEIRTLSEDPKRNGNGRIRHDPRPKGRDPGEDKQADPGPDPPG
jgi:hypothetical protein